MSTGKADDPPLWPERDPGADHAWNTLGQAIIDFLKGRGMRYFDLNRVHVEDFRSFRLTLDDYLKRYLIRHYSSAENHFFAFARKNVLVDWLDPKPVLYR